MKNNFFKALNEISNIKFYQNYNFKNDNSLKIDTIISLLIIPNDIYSLKKVILLLNDYEKPYLVIGNATKILFKDHFVKKAIIILKHNFSNISYDGRAVYACSGCSLIQLISFIHNYSLGGIEKLVGIPATIGGAIYNNVSAHNIAISDYILKIDYLDAEGNFKTMSKNDANFSYRSSIFHTNKKLIILGALFSFQKINIDEANLLIKEAVLYRKKHQPSNLISCGSIFKNGDSYKAYELIKSLDKEKLTYNSVYISSKHYNFLDSNGQQTANDIIMLINQIKNEIFKKYNIDIKLELEII